MMEVSTFVQLFVIIAASPKVVAVFQPLNSSKKNLCRFGGFLVSRELAQIGDIITVFFSILVGAFYFGQSGPNLQKLTEARGAATPIYDIIDRVSMVVFNALIRSIAIITSLPSKALVFVLNGPSLSRNL